MPGSRLLELYAKAGGYHITLGSDAHEPEQVGTGIERGLALGSSYGFQPCWFENKKLKTGVWG